MTKEEILKLFDPYLKQMNPNYAKNLIDYELLKILLPNQLFQPIIRS